MTRNNGKIYTFRSGPFGSGNTVVALAPMDHVIAVFGDGGLFGEGGLSTAFSHVAIYRGKESDDAYFGVWGARRAERFRAALAARFALETVNTAPAARLTYWAARDMNALRRARHRGFCSPFENTATVTAENRS